MQEENEKEASGLQGACPETVRQGVAIRCPGRKVMRPHARCKAALLAKAGLLAVAALAALAGSAGSAAAATPGVAWAVHSVAQPTSFSSDDTEQEIVKVGVSATGGTFTLAVEGETTVPIAYNATPAEVGAALNALPSIGGVGGNVTVTGGPGDENATHPYIIVVAGSLAGRNFESFTGEGSSLTGGEHTVHQPDVARIGRFIDEYTVVLTNVGSRASQGTVTLTDVLPNGMTTTGITTKGGVWQCTPSAGNEVVTCTSESPVAALTPAPAIFIHVAVSPSASGTLSNQVEVSGGEANVDGSATTPTQIGAPAPSFGLVDFDASALDPAGVLDTEAGDHPSALTTAFDVPSAISAELGEVDAYPVEDIKQIVVDLPTGVIGDAQAAPTCTLIQLANFGDCPAATQVGTLTLIEPPATQPGAETNLVIYNIVPERGYPAEFGVFDKNISRAAVMYGMLRSRPEGNGVRIVSQDLPQALPVNGVVATFFGYPAVKNGSGNPPTAFATNPSDCNVPSFVTTIHVDSWQQPARMNPDGTPDFSDPRWKEARATSPAVSGCGALQFHPTISLLPDTKQPDTPTALKVDLRVPQNEDPSGLATPPLKDATVTLPRGLVISPSSADGLEGCSDAQIALSSADPGSCPLGSQIATVLVHTPLLKEPLEGQVFLGTPLCDPCSSTDARSGQMLRLFIQVHSEQYGVTIKLPGTVAVDPTTAQLTATFMDTPQQPFDDLKLQFKQGPRAALATPSSCGMFKTTSDLAPWSSPFTADAVPSSSFEVADCGSANQFVPVFKAGTVNPQSGAYSPFSLDVSRQDTDQQFSSLSVALPPGLLAKLAGVPLCSDTDASNGNCPAATQIGSVTTGAGPGSHPFFLPGRVFLTGAYKGGPYGLAVEVPAVAGPFNLGTVVVRQSLRIDPHTAQVTVVSDPFPTILDGIPLQIRTVDVRVDRPEFALNPTSCEPMQVAGTLTSVGSLSLLASSRFQTANCASLPFKPSFAAATQGKTSKQKGASLDVKVAQKPGEADIHKVDVQLPLALPSRLTTLQKACTEAQFASNPAGCPEASVVGTATAHTPLLTSSLTGPAYLVSHGGAAFPDLIIVLQGDGITIDLVGNTDIKKGVTFSRFESVPDAPIDSFELNLPEGPHSALATNVNLCSPTKLVMTRKRITVRRRGRPVQVVRAVEKRVVEPLLMPTTIVGQNGARVTQSTKIAVTGCRKARVNVKAKKHKRAKRKSS